MKWYERKVNPNYRRWTDREVIKLTRYVRAGYSFGDIAMLLGRKKKNVYNKACIEGLYVPKRRPWTKREDRLLSGPYLYKQHVQVAAMLGRTPESVRHRKRVLGIPHKIKLQEKRAEA